MPLWVFPHLRRWPVYSSVHTLMRPATSAFRSKSLLASKNFLGKFRLLETARDLFMKKSKICWSESKGYAATTFKNMAATLAAQSEHENWQMFVPSFFQQSSVWWVYRMVPQYFLKLGAHRSKKCFRNTLDKPQKNKHTFCQVKEIFLKHTQTISNLNKNQTQEIREADGPPSKTLLRGLRLGIGLQQIGLRLFRQRLGFLRQLLLGRTPVGCPVIASKLPILKCVNKNVWKKSVTVRFSTILPSGATKIPEGPSVCLIHFLLGLFRILHGFRFDLALQQKLEFPAWKNRKTMDPTNKTLQILAHLEKTKTQLAVSCFLCFSESWWCFATSWAPKRTQPLMIGVNPGETCAFKPWPWRRIPTCPLLDSVSSVETEEKSTYFTCYMTQHDHEKLELTVPYSSWWSLVSPHCGTKCWEKTWQKQVSSQHRRQKQNCF